VASKESKVFSAVCKNKDIHAILGEPDELFGAYGDVYSFIKEFYYTHKMVPDAALVNERFDGAELEVPAMDVPTAHYLDELKHEYIKNKLESVSLNMSKALKEKRGTPAEVLGKAQTELAKLGRFTANSRDLNMTDYENAEEYFEKVREISEANGGTPGISTTFDSIDSAYTSGLEPGHFVVVLGFTGRMKSMWTDLLAVQAWRQGYKVMIISLEMTPEEQRARIYSLMGSGKFRISDLNNGRIDQDNFREWSKKNLADSSDFIVTSNEGVGDVTPNFIQSKIDMHKPDFVIVDYMQLMYDNARSRNMVERMTNLSHELKRLAMSNNLPLLAITAVTDDDGEKRDAPPSLSQVSWSSAIEYDANLALAVHKHTDTNIVEIAGRKNRHGPLFRFFFQVDADLGIWEEKFDLDGAA
jgi:replicative DNA helicase